MDPDKQTTERLFQAAQQLATADQQAAFLQIACQNDAALRERVEALLRAEEKASTFLQAPADAISLNLAPGAEPPPSLAQKPGDHIGRYKLLEQIGEGGCGVVYVADQEQPIRRRVALKVIKLGMDTRQVVARFEAERQALALMDHPNIAKVLDAGATDTGRPFFVMELIKGIKITDYCDQNNLSTSERLCLFIQVCHAVQHAHQKGIIHRDLKPSNILVTLHDGVPVPKVIDFGIAKAVAGQTLTDKTLYTAFEQFVGTPAYMSPEQAEMSGLDIDTRTDLYSLGVLLYELLTGKTPFDAKRLLQAGLEEIRRIIREEEPPRPSTKLSTLLAEERTTTARRRQTDPPKLIHLVRGDLDWIVMKCLEKDRTRRYDTADGLALDIERHLESEPIMARPPSTLYRFQKVLRRNKLAFGAASVVVAALVVALGVSSWSLLQERTARSRAETAEKRALTEAERANRNAATELDQRKRAESNEAEARNRLIRLSVANGNHLVEQGDRFGGLLWFVEALELDRDHSTREAIHRMRIGSLLAECPKLLQLWIHKGPISSVAFSPNGQYLVTTRRAVAGIASDPSSDNYAQIWDVNTGAAFGPPMVHTGIVWGAVFSLDGRKLLTRSSGPGGGGHEQAQVWDALTASPVTPPLQYTGWVACAIFSPSNTQIALWVTDRDRSPSFVQLLDLASGQPVCAPIYIKGNPFGDELSPPLLFSPDGNNLLVRGYIPNSTKRELWVLDTSTGAQVAPRWIADSLPLGAAFSGDGKLVTTLNSNGVARVFRVTSGEPVTVPLQHDLSRLVGAAFSPDSRLLATIGGSAFGGQWEQESTIWEVATSAALTKPLEGIVNFRADGYPVLMKGNSAQFGQEIVQMFDPITGERAGPIFEHRWGSQVVLSPTDFSFAKSGWDGLVWLWELAAETSPLTTLEDPPGGLSGSFSQGGEYLVTSASDGTARVVRTDSGQETSAVVLQQNGWTGVSVSADGQQLATFGTNAAAQVWNALTGQPMTPPLRHKYPLVKCASFSPDGTRLATISAKPHWVGADRFDLWDAQTGKSLSDPSVASRPANFAAFSRDSKRVLTTGLAGQAYLWDAGTGLEIRAVGDMPWLLEGPGTAGAFSPDSRWIVAPGTSGQVWDAASGQPIGRPMKHTGGVLRAVFSPDGLRVATAGHDSTARIWDPRSGQPVTAALKHPASVGLVTFSHDGRLLATACDDNRVRLWDTATGESVTQPLKHPGNVYDMTFSTDSSRLLTACSDRRVRIWQLPADSRPIPDLILLAQLLAGRRIDQTSSLEPLDTDALRSAWETLKSRYAGDFRRTRPEILARHENQARYCEKVALWKPAIWHLDHLIEAQPRESKWRKWRGWLYARAGEKERADADFSAATQLGASEENLWWQVAQAWQGCGHLDEALLAMERVGEPGSRNSSFWVAKAMILEKTNRLNEAYQALGKALSLAPSEDFVWRALVSFGDRHGGLEKAVQLFEATARSNPANVELNEFAALNRGVLLERTNQLDEAYKAYSTALQLGGLSPRSVHTREQLLSRRSDVLKRLGRHAESIADFEKWLGLSSLGALECNDMAWGFATGTADNRDPERALLLAKKAVGLECTNALYVDTLGVAYYRAGQWLKAAEELQDAIKLSAGNSSYPLETDLLFLAMTYHQVGDPMKAKDYYKKALQEWGKHRAPGAELMSFRDEAEKLLGISTGP